MWSPTIARQKGIPVTVPTCNAATNTKGEVGIRQGVKEGWIVRAN